MRGPGRAHPLLILLFFPIAALVLSGCDNGPFSSDRTMFRAAQVQVDDPLYGEQWYLPMIRAEQAWQLVADHEVRTGRLSAVPVAVIDTAVDTGHEDLHRVLTRDGYNFVTREVVLVSSPPPPEDEKHGTHVAGIVGAERENGVGITGAGFNRAGSIYTPLMSLVMLQFIGFDNRGNPLFEGSLADLAESLLYAAGIHNSSGRTPAAPARVINMSLGTATLESSLSEFLHGVVRRVAATDVVLLAAAGNDGVSSVHFPARFPEVIAVGSINRDESRSFFSNYGKDLELVAPGAERFAGGDVMGLVSTFPADRYGQLPGTSMAAPLVAGVAAMIRSVNPDLTAPEVRAILRETALDLGEAGRDDQFGYGLVNAEAAIEAAIRAGRGTDTVLRGRVLDPAPSYSLSAGPRIPAPWDPAGSRDIAILLDEDALDRMGVTDAAGRIRETTGLDVRGEGPLLRGTLPRELDGDVVLHTLYDLGFVLSALQDRVLAWR